MSKMAFMSDDTGLDVALRDDHTKRHAICKASENTDAVVLVETILGGGCVQQICRLADDSNDQS